MPYMIPWSLLLFANLAVGIGVVYVKHANQLMFREIQQQRQTYHDLQTEWGRLLLEQATLIGHARLEEAAEQRLRMHRPKPSDIQLLSP